MKYLEKKNNHLIIDAWSVGHIVNIAVIQQGMLPDVLLEAFESGTIQLSNHKKYELIVKNNGRKIIAENSDWIVYSYGEFDVLTVENFKNTYEPYKRKFMV